MQAKIDSETKIFSIEATIVEKLVICKTKFAHKNKLRYFCFIGLNFNQSED